MRSASFPRPARSWVGQPVVCLRVIGLVILLLSVTGAMTYAQTEAITMTVKAGFDGQYKQDAWLPVRIILTNQGPDVNGNVKIAVKRYDNSFIDYIRPVELPSGARKEVYMYLSIEGYMSEVTVNFVPDNNSPVTQKVRLSQISSSDLLYGVLAGSPTPFNILTSINPVNGRSHLAQLELADLPPASLVWQSLDVLVISDVDTGQFSQAQREAIQAWVSNGGRLIVAGGPSWQKVAAGLGDLLPLVPTGAETVSGLAALSTYANEAVPADSALITVGTLQPGAIALVNTGSGLPLITEKYLGYGRIDFLTFDPGLAPFRENQKSWDGMEGIYRTLLSSAGNQPGWAGVYRNWSNANQALSLIPGIGLPQVWQICTFVFGYVLIVGPLNYALMRRFKRRELAWITIPAIIILFTGLTYIGSFGLYGNRPTLHRLTVAQVWEDSDRARVESLVGIFSPLRSEYDLKVDGDLLLRPLPTEGYFDVNTSLEGALINQGEAMAINNIRVDVGEVKPFVAQGQVAAPKFTSSLKLSVDSLPATVDGFVVNESDLTLRNAVMLAFGAYQPLGDIAPGAKVQVKIPIFVGQASQVTQSQVPISPLGFNNGCPSCGTSSTNPYPGNSDTIVQNILGSDYYKDRESYRRYSLLTWLLDPYNGSDYSGTYLVGWTDRSPVDIALTDSSFNTADQTLYLIQLRPTLETGAAAGKIIVNPGLMTWEVLDANVNGPVGPYGNYLLEGEFALRFKPFTKISYTKVNSLVLHFNGSGRFGPLPETLRLSLRDQQSGEWVAVPDVHWGDTLINAPARYVGGDGRIDVKVENMDPQASFTLDNLDFTLEVER